MRDGNRGCSVVRRLAIALATAPIALVVASPASGATTIGSDLSAPPFGAPCSVAACTLANSSLSGRQTASPISGVIVRWRVRNGGTDPGGNTVHLRVIREAGGGTFTGVSTGDTQTILDLDGVNPSTQVFATRLVIGAGDLVALDADPPHGNLNILGFPGSGATRAFWDPPLANGATLAPSTVVSSTDEYLYNADVEPDCDGDGFGDETQDPSIATCFASPASVPAPKPAELLDAKAKGKKLLLELSCAPGGPCTDNEIAVRTAKKLDLSRIATAAKRKRILLAKGSETLAAGETKTVRLKLRKRGRKLFRARKKVRAKATITAAGGSATEKLTIK